MGLVFSEANRPERIVLVLMSGQSGKLVPKEVDLFVREVPYVGELRRSNLLSYDCMLR